MLLELKRDQLVVDGKPYVQNMRMNINPKKRLIRLKFEYVTDGDPEPIDLALEFEGLNISVPSISIGVEVQELRRNIYFRASLSFSLTKKRFSVSGVYINPRGEEYLIQRDIYSPIELLTLIRSIILNYERSKKQ